jgi:hypothetical protein
MDWSERLGRKEKKEIEVMRGVFVISRLTSG